MLQACDNELSVEQQDMQVLLHALWEVCVVLGALPALFYHSLLWQSVQLDVLEACRRPKSQEGPLVTKTLRCSLHCELQPASGQH